MVTRSRRITSSTLAGSKRTTSDIVAAEAHADVELAGQAEDVEQRQHDDDDVVVRIPKSRPGVSAFM